MLTTWGVPTDKALASLVIARTGLIAGQILFILLGLPFFLHRLGLLRQDGIVLLPLLGLLTWLAGRGMSPGALFGMGGRWVTEAGWSLLVRVTGAVVRSGIFQWLMTTGSDLVGGTRGLSMAGVLFAIAIPASGLMLVRLLRTPVEGMTHAH